MANQQNPSEWGWVSAPGENSAWWTSDYVRQAQTKWRLETGGKKVPKRESLWQISGTAAELLDKRWVLPPFEDARQRTIMPTNITIMKQPLDASGSLWLTLADGESHDVTPEVAGKDFYKFTVAKAKERLEVTGVTFTGDAATYPILCDTNGVAYPGAHWGSNIVTHVVSNKPALYVSGSRVSASVDFAALGGGLGTNLVVRGIVSGGATSFELRGTNTAPGATNWNVAVYADKPLSNNLVDFYKPMTVAWSYAVQGKTNFLDAGISTNQVYVSWKAPIATAHFYHTAVHLACSKTGAASENQVVTNTWSFFSSKDVKTWDDVPLTYYGTSSPQYLRWTADLLEYRDGRCNGFVGLLLDALWINGVTSVRWTDVSPADGNLEFAIKNVEFGLKAYTDDPDQFYYSRPAITPSGMAGQNTDSPLRKIFLGHVIVHRGAGTEYYDPSYGITTTGPTNYATHIDGWSKAADADRWRKADGSGLVPKFNDP